MPDNPRYPGHPSDMPSSRSSDTGGAGGQQHVNYPPSYQATPPSAPNHQTRNIILGAVATVITSTLIYYLTVYLNNSKNSGTNHLERKEATIEAWKSYKAYENTYTNNLLSLEKTVLEEGNLEGYRAGMHTESEKFNKDLKDLSETKMLDKDLVKAFNRRLENEKTFMGEADKYFKNIVAALSATGNIKKLKEDYVAEELRWSRYYKGAYERSINDVKEIAKTLSERYGQPFSLDDFLLVQLQPKRQREADSILNVLQNINIDSNGNIIPKSYEKNLIKKDFEGTWNVDGDVVMLESNSTLSWNMAEGGKASGVWKIENDLLKVDATVASTKEKVIWNFKISSLTPTSFTITQSDPPYQQYDVTRIK